MTTRYARWSKPQCNNVASPLHLQRVIASASGLISEDGQQHHFDHVVATTGAQAPACIQAAGWRRIHWGFVAVNSRHQSLPHPNVFAAGDVCSRPTPGFSRSGYMRSRPARCWQTICCPSSPIRLHRLNMRPAPPRSIYWQPGHNTPSAPGAFLLSGRLGVALERLDRPRLHSPL